MSKPVVALVGRPNVGKSTLFNRLAGERLAIVDDIPGTTRDRLVAESEWNNVKFQHNRYWRHRPHARWQDDAFSWFCGFCPGDP